MIKKKKSLIEAMVKAEELSRNNPERTVWVLDRKREKAVISTVDWVVEQRNIDGWDVVAVYKNGRNERSDKNGQKNRIGRQDCPGL